MASIPLTIQLNGVTKAFEAPLTVADLIHRIEIPSPSVAVAVNSEIVPRSEFQSYQVKDRDRVEIIRAVAGG
ncbi:MAG TPA: sulfur carrier protein ThiS [bacterium]|nr:sulfur carrier protein ThiS [bacterium]